MRTRRSTPSPDVTVPARDLFESSALYDLVSRLAIDTYEDLLAPHWAVPDRLVPREHLADERFTRRRSRAVANAVLALHADRAAGSRHGLRRGVPLVGSFRLPPASPRIDPDATRPDVERPSGDVLNALRRGVTWCIAWLRRLARMHR